MNKNFNPKSNQTAAREKFKKLEKLEEEIEKVNKRERIEIEKIKETTKIKRNRDRKNK